jgi:GTPase SAR1 family protein
MQFIPYYGQGDLEIDSLVRSALWGLTKNGIDSKDEFGNTVLLLACQYKHEDLVRILLDKGANPNALNFSGACCLHFACYRESLSLPIAKILLENGATPDIAETSFGCTPLHYCAGNGDFKLSELVLSYGAQINAVDSYGYTCVDYALELGFKETANFLHQKLKNSKTLGNAQEKCAQISLISQTIQVSLIIFFKNYDPSRLQDLERLMTQFKGREVDLANELQSRYKLSANNLEFDVLLYKAKELQSLYARSASDETVSDVNHTDPLVIQDLIQEKQKKLEIQLADDEKYLTEALSLGKKEWKRSKIMIVGEGRAGKTAFANSILGRAYEDMDSTIGINEFTCSIGYATVESNEHRWKELKNQKKSKELESALASMIFDQKVSKPLNPIKTISWDIDQKPQKLKGSSMEGENCEVSSPESESSVMITKFEKIPNDNAAIAQTSDSPAAKTFILNKAQNSTPVTISHTREKESIETTIDKFFNHFPPQSKEIDSSLVMKYLGERSMIESKFIVSVFDFGGQSVFNMIHPFFLTRCGVYVITFNMEWLASSADLAIREECIRYMSFWLNSVIIHSRNEKEEIAPVVFVGTRKDLITSPEEHQAISTSLYNIFSNSPAWSYVIENNGATVQFGKADLCFFPVNNKLGNQDPTVQKLLQLIESAIDASNYVHVERPLSWFKVLDIFKSKNVPYLKYSEVVSIVVSCNISDHRVPTLLRFFHEMGILMWHDEDSLRDVIVFDAIEYFVKPATIIICQHAPNQSDGIYHSLEIHRKVKKLFPKEFREMVQHGIISEPLLVALLAEFSQNYAHIKQLMLKYGLLVPLKLAQSGEEDDTKNQLDSSMEEFTLYLAPALLSEKELRCGSIVDSSHHSFSFIFTPSNDLSQMPTITLDDCSKLGFLPSGLFEKLVSKAISWSMTTSNYVSRASLYNCYKNCAELAFGNQRFRMMVDYDHNLITIHVLDGNNPLSIHDRLRDQIQEIICECLKSLKFISVLTYQTKKTNDVEKDDLSGMLLIRLSQIRSLVETKSALSVGITWGRNLLSSTEAIQLYGPWLTDLLCYNEFDLFLSYRWNLYDSKFTHALFDRLSLHVVDETLRVIRTFLDIKRLQAGQNYQMNLVNSLSKSLLIVPIVSCEALEAMMKMTSTSEDNLLLEWICGLELMKHHEKHPGSTRLMKFMPIFFGTRTDENSTKDFFQEDIVSKLPNILPTACLELSKKLLSKAGITMSSEMENATLKDIVGEVTKYLFLCGWKSNSFHQLTIQAANEIAMHVNECLKEQQSLQASKDSPSDDRLSQQPLLSPVPNGNEAVHRCLSLIELKELIRKALGIETGNVQDVLKEALLNLSGEEQEECNAIKVSKDKAHRIAELLGLI